ncbi:E3 ubiquitin-protein ligase SH3RF1 isoform X3 [Ambystoma mexicanum]|uniref:E3 ubiquitin-protein ligase SH3RF1 isoform X3 n=1 Tax=Ambystoma mexicanum TaxID=8296 RepID=UPI0037E8F726
MLISAQNSLERKMDESALLDLLECPVCLERLDAAAKVLPCQHTFCKRCLLGIVSSRNELRCPECRTLVDCGVDDLPSNILLVRLLDGIKQRPRKAGSGGNGINSLRTQGGTTTNCGPKDLPSSQVGGQSRVQAWSPPVRGVPQLPCAKALYNYEGKEPGDLKFSKGDIIILRRQVDDNWYHGEINSVHGFFPTNFVQIIKPLPQPPPQCKALYDFEVKDKEADKDCLPFSKDDILTVIRRVDENWAEGMLGDKIGIFPISYVEVHISTTGLIVTPPPSSPIITGPSFTFPPEVTYQAALGDLNPPLLPPPPLAAAVIASTSSAAASSVVGQRPAPASVDPIAALRSQNRPSVYVAIYPYAPRKEDELELRKGEMFLVFERCQDGWFKGTSMHTNKMGVFPGNYVAAVTRAVTNASQAKAAMATAGQTGQVVTMVSPSTAAGPSQKVQGNGVDFNKVVCSNGVPTAVIPATHIQTSPQAKVLMHMSGQMTVNQARNAVRTAAIHSQERPTAAVTPIQAQTSTCLLPTASSAPHHQPSCQQLQPQLSTSAAYLASAVNVNRSTIPMAGSTASMNCTSGTSASFDGDTCWRGTPASLENALSAANSTTIKSDKDSKKEKKGLLKLLSGASTKRKPRSSPPQSPTLEVEQGAVELALQGAVGPEVPSAVSHGRAGSCPVDSDASAAAQDTLHRKTSSLDTNVPIAPPPRQPCSSLVPGLNDPRPLVCERCRVVVSYPPQSEAELELKEGDIVFVHKKREDGWYKGTLQRNGKTGLFPGSFVENI